MRRASRSSRRPSDRAGLGRTGSVQHLSCSAWAWRFSPRSGEWRSWDDLARVGGLGLRARRRLSSESCSRPNWCSACRSRWPPFSSRAPQSRSAPWPSACRSRAGDPNWGPRGARGLGAATAAFALLVAVYLGALFRAGRLAGLSAWDAWAFWVPKARPSTSSEAWTSSSSACSLLRLPAARSRAGHPRSTSWARRTRSRSIFSSGSSRAGFVAAVAGILAPRCPGALLPVAVPSARPRGAARRRPQPRPRRTSSSTTSSHCARSSSRSGSSSERRGCSWVPPRSWPPRS